MAMMKTGPMPRGRTAKIAKRLELVRELVAARGVIAQEELARLSRMTHNNIEYVVKLLGVRCKTLGGRVTLCGDRVDDWMEAVRRRIREIALGNGCMSRCCGVSIPAVLRDMKIVKLLKAVGIPPVQTWPGINAVFVHIAAVAGSDMYVLRRKNSVKIIVCHG